MPRLCEGALTAAAQPAYPGHAWPNGTQQPRGAYRHPPRTALTASSDTGIGSAASMRMR